MKRLIIFSLFLLFCFTNLSAQNLSETHQKIKTAVENRDYPAASGELKSLEKSDKKLFELNNYDYLLARLLEKTGDLAGAAAGYQSAANRNSILKEYALWHLSQIARASGNLMLERVYLQEISVFAPESLLKTAVQTRTVQSLFESKNYDSVIAQLSALGSQQAANTTKTNGQSATSSGLSRENQLLLGQAYLQSGRTTEARDIFTKLAGELANPAQPDDYALAAVRVLDELDGGRENFGKIAPTIAEGEHLRRASIYQFNRNFPLARLHFQAIVERFPESPNVASALYQIGRTYAQEGNFLQAIESFERVQSQFPGDAIAKDALSQTASAYSRLNKPKESVSRYQKFIEKYADADNLDRAYLNIIDVLRDAGEDGDALKWSQKTQEAFRGKLPEALALFASARIHIVQNDWQNALTDLEKILTFADLGGTRVPGGTNKSEITFMKGFVLENLQRYPEAIDVYLSIPDGRSEYYGWRATDRIKALAADEKAKSYIVQKMGELTKNIEIRNAEAQRNAAQAVLRLSENAEIRARMLEILKKAYSTLPDYQKVPVFKLAEFGRKEVLKDARENKIQNYHQILADELLFLALYDEAAPEMEKSGQSSAVSSQNNVTTNNDVQATNKSPKPKTEDQNNFNYSLAVFYKRGDMANRAVAFLEPVWKQVPADYQIELMPREQAEMLYPAPFADALLQYAPEKNLDARFLLSIMRQESRYRADVKSNAAARGLMQFISTTSEKIAAELARANFKQDELYNPPTAIQFGSQYLANLFRQFPNQPQAVAASYNGGEDNVARWLARSKSDNPDRYVPEIVFSQSKDYVYKVMANYRVYQTIYDEKLQKR
ncbi:MAG TPA: transglycosylase SLT domain-containing protein [Pyrinomonadaceae bacterium]